MHDFLLSILKPTENRNMTSAQIRNHGMRAVLTVEFGYPMIRGADWSCDAWHVRGPDGKHGSGYSGSIFICDTETAADDGSIIWQIIARTTQIDGADDDLQEILIGPDTDVLEWLAEGELIMEWLHA